MSFVGVAWPIDSAMVKGGNRSAHAAAAAFFPLVALSMMMLQQQQARVSRKKVKRKPPQVISSRPSQMQPVAGPEPEPAINVPEVEPAALPGPEPALVDENDMGNGNVLIVSSSIVDDAAGAFDTNVGNAIVVEEPVQSDEFQKACSCTWLDFLPWSALPRIID